MGISIVTLAASRHVGPDGLAVRSGTWVNDSILQLLLRLMALHVPEPAPGAERGDSRAIRDQWLLASALPFTGCVPHDPEAIAMTRDGLFVARSALTSLILALDGMPPRVSGELFSLLGMGEPGAVDIRTDDLKAVASDIVGLMDAYGQPDRS